jgi:hypothetical protein
MSKILTKTSEFLAVALGTIVASLLLGALLVFPIMWLWNWLVPELFNGPTITFWQSAGLFVLCNMLLKSSTSYNSKND